MNEPTEEELMALADGTLPRDQASRLEDLLRRRPDLARRVEIYRQTGRELGKLIPEPDATARMEALARSILAHPLPAAGQAAPAKADAGTADGGKADGGKTRSGGPTPITLRPAGKESGERASDASGKGGPAALNGGTPPNGAKVLPFERPAKARPAPGTPTRSPMAIAATIALLLASAVALKMYGDSQKAQRIEEAANANRPASGGTRTAGVSRVAAATLTAALESTPMNGAANSPADGWNITPLLTFSSQDGRYCRKYAAQRPTETMIGVACRDTTGTWSAKVESAGRLEDKAANRSKPAGLASPPEVDAAVDQRKGDVLSLEEEQEAMRRGWKARN